MKEDEREEAHDDILRFGFPCLISTGEDHPGRIQLDGGNLLLLLRLKLATETHVITLAKIRRISMELHKLTTAPKTAGFRFYL